MMIIKKKNSFHYFLPLNEIVHHVCKLFFLNTLGISERTIYYFFAQHSQESDTTPKIITNRGRKPIEAAQMDEVKSHISSFPTVDSHYCRSTTSRKFLESHLTVSKMYNMYKTTTDNPVKLEMYRSIFNNHFNLGFHVPKKDLCDKCPLYKANEKSYTEAEKLDYKKHIDEKKYTKAERDMDIQSIDGNSAILFYDLENVFTIPKMFASTFYYKRKLCVYNLTATPIVPGIPKVTYCALWNETVSGRSGNDIASALIKILTKLVEDHPNVNRITLWSDSCVPQNRNKITSTAILQFLHQNVGIIEITQKFCEPGHSCL